MQKVNAWKKKDTSVNSVLELCLKNLGVSSTEEINDWFRRSRNGGYRIDGLDKIAALLLAFKDETVVVCGDYDADGVTATAIMVLLMRQLGFKNVDYMIPHRHSEGYGLNARMVNEIADKHKGERICLFTVDNGIVCFEPIALAKSLGMTVIVTDHHLGQIGEDGKIVLPKAAIIVDPSAMPETADFTGYCGAELAYRLAVHMLGASQTRLMLPLAAIAAFADVMPLREETYVFAREGLRYINQGYVVPGLRELLKAVNVENATEDDIYFRIAPCLNAPGRLQDDGAEKCVRLLISDQDEAADLAREIFDINEERKALVKSAIEKVAVNDHGTGKAIITGAGRINPGVVGIIAGHILEDTGLPTIVFTPKEDDRTRLSGSARSVEGLHMRNILVKTDEIFKETHDYSVFESFGGHEGAAGLTIRTAEYNNFVDCFYKALDSIGFQPTPKDNYYDLEIHVSDISEAIRSFERFAPFGEGNPRPVFKVVDFKPLKQYDAYYKAIGTDGIKFMDDSCEAVSFGNRDHFTSINSPDPVAFYGTLSVNSFRGVSKNQILIQDFSA